MKNFSKWVATSPIAGALKIFLGALLAIAFDSIDSFNLSPFAALLITAVIPVAIDALNPHDPRFGRGKAPSLQDLLDAILPVLVDPKAEDVSIESVAKKPKKS
jgi:hypothetical protein